jgi:amidase
LAWADNFGGMPITNDTREALAHLANELQRHGCHIEQQLPEQFDFHSAWETFGELWQAETGSALTAEGEADQARGLTTNSDDPFLRGMARRVSATMRQYSATLRQRDVLIERLELFFEQWDALLCPVAITPALPHGPIGAPIAVDDQIVPYWTGTMAYCGPFNLTGHPAVVVPLAQSSEGLPIGLQIVGRLWGEMEILAIAAQLSKVIGFFQRPPGY